MSLAVWVAGIPAPQGSKRAYVNRHTGRPQVVESSDALKPWREDVRQAAIAALDGAPPLDGPCIVRLTFWLPRPKSHPKTRRTLPDTRPDLDKLARGVCDALTSAGAIRDDAVIVDLPLQERYVHPLPLALDWEPVTPGVWIEAEPITVEQADELTRRPVLPFSQRMQARGDAELRRLMSER